MENKKCFTCKEQKAISDFIKNRSKSSGYYGSCKKCTYLKVKSALLKAEKKIIYLPENLLKERWLPLIIKEFKTKFLISDCGRIFNNKTKIFSKITENVQYPIISLHQNGKQFTKRIHILVGIHFVENTLNCNYLNHKDGNKHNTHFSNLEWTTSKDNRKHAIETGLVKFARGGNHPLARQIVDKSTGVVYGSAKEASDFLKIKRYDLVNRLRGLVINDTNMKYV